MTSPTTARACFPMILALYDYGREATREITDIIRVHNRRGVFHTEIADDPRAEEAPSHGIPLVMYARSRATRAYERLTTEVMERRERTGRRTRRIGHRLHPRANCSRIGRLLTRVRPINYVMIEGHPRRSVVRRVGRRISHGYA